MGGRIDHGNSEMNSLSKLSIYDETSVYFSERLSVLLLVISITTKENVKEALLLLTKME